MWRKYYFGLISVAEYDQLELEVFLFKSDEDLIWGRLIGISIEIAYLLRYHLPLISVFTWRDNSTEKKFNLHIIRYDGATDSQSSFLI